MKKEKTALSFVEFKWCSKKVQG